MKAVDKHPVPGKWAGNAPNIPFSGEDQKPSRSETTIPRQGILGGWRLAHVWALGLQRAHASP